MRFRLFALSLLFVVAVAGVWTRQASPAQLALEAARKVETIDRDLKGAVVRYRAVVSMYPKDRVVVPEALIGLAGCLEQLGQPPEARATYERVVKDYPDSVPAKVARTKLATLGMAGSGLTITRLDGDSFGVPSGDGSYLSFTDSESGDLAVRNLKSGQTRRLTDSANLGTGQFASGSVPSPDGRRIAYSWVGGHRGAELRVISSRGGAAQVLCCSDDRAVHRPHGWSVDGKLILFSLLRMSAGKMTMQLATVSASGGEARVLKAFDGAVGRASWSPDGRFIIYEAPRTVGKIGSALFIMGSDGSNAAVLIPHGFNDQMLDWFPDGKRILFVSDLNGPNAVFTQRIADGKAVGDPLLVKDNLGDGFGIIEGQGFTRDGSYHYVTQTAVQDVFTFRLNAVGAQSPAARLAGRFVNNKQGAAWSPDGNEIAYVQVMQPMPVGYSTYSLSIQSNATGRIRTVPTELHRLLNPAWMPDGQAIIAEGLTAQDGYGLFQVRLETGAVSPIGEIITARGTLPVRTGIRSRPVVSLDGREVLYTLDSKSVQARDLSSGAVRVVFEGQARALALSPDGRFIAVSGSDHVQGQPAVQIVSVTGGPARGLAANIETGELGAGIAWSADGNYVWFTQYSGRADMPLWRVPVDDGPAQRMSALSRGVAPTINRLSAAPDGSMAVSVSMRTTEHWVMRNIPPAAKR